MPSLAHHHTPDCCRQIALLTVRQRARIVSIVRVSAEGAPGKPDALADQSGRLTADRAIEVAPAEVIVTSWSITWDRRYARTPATVQCGSHASPVNVLVNAGGTTA